VAELDAIGVAAVFTADAQFQIWIGLAPFLNGHAYQLANPVAVKRLEGVGRQNLDFALDARFGQAVDVLEQELYGLPESLAISYQKVGHTRKSW